MNNLSSHENELFPGFPPEPVTNYWPYPKALNGWWHILNGSEQKCLDYILRHTWGFKKAADYISLSQFKDGVRNLDKGTGLSKPTIIEALNGLEEKGFIKRTKNAGNTTEYELVKNFNITSKNSLPVSSKGSLHTIKDLTIKDNNIVSLKGQETQKTLKTEITFLIGYLSQKLGGVKFPNYGKQAKYIKSMLDAGYIVDDITWAIDQMYENPWWRNNSFDLKNVADEIPKLMTRTVKGVKNE